jgi:hypothetical protein
MQAMIGGFTMPAPSDVASGAPWYNKAARSPVQRTQGTVTYYRKCDGINMQTRRLQQAKRRVRSTPCNAGRRAPRSTT